MGRSDLKIQLERRTLVFSVAVIRMLRSLPLGYEMRNIRDQLLRSSTSVGANYREANRAESLQDFSHKMGIVAKEAAETEYWLLVLGELNPGIDGLQALLAEASELTRIFGTSQRTLSNRSRA